MSALLDVLLSYLALYSLINSNGNDIGVFFYLLSCHFYSNRKFTGLSNDK